MQKKGIKIQLSLVDDVKQATGSYYEKVDTAISKAQGGIKTLKDSMNSFESAMQVSNNLNTLLSKVNAAAKELGVDPKNWPMYNELTTAISDIKNTQSKLNALKKAISTLEG